MNIDVGTVDTALYLKQREALSRVIDSQADDSERDLLIGLQHLNDWIYDQLVPIEELAMSAKLDIQKQHYAKALLMWDAFDDNEKRGVRFGMFPHDKMKEAESQSFDSHTLSTMLMDIAQKNGGMIA